MRNYLRELTGVYENLFIGGKRLSRKDTNERPIYHEVGKNRRKAKKKRNKRR